MRFRASSSAAFVASLLVNEAVGSVHRGHQQRYHAKREDVIVTDDVVETVTVTNYVTVEWPPASSDSTTTSRSTTTLTVLYKPSSSSVPTPVSSAPPAATVIPAVAVAAVPATTLATVVKPVSSTAPAAEPTTAQPVVVAAAKAAVPSSVAPSSDSTTPASSSSKRGACYNNAALVSGFTGSKVSWAYNWDSASSGLSSAFEYVPMLWGTGSNFVNPWAQRAQAAIDSGSKHLLAFNEPDHPEQANIPVSVAVDGYKTHMQPFAGKAKLGSPAVTNGGAPMGLAYLQSFVQSCVGCTIDFVNCHWYDSAANVEYFKKHVADTYTAGGNRPVWITEFGASGSAAEQNAFLQEVIPWLDSLGYVERYAYFMASDGVLFSGTALSTLGQTFASV